MFKREFTAGQTSVLPVCLPLTESSGSSLCDRQFYQSVELLKHKTPGIPVCLQPQRAKRHRPHWVTASALLFSRTLSPPPPNTPLPCFSISLCTCLSFFLPLYNPPDSCYCFPSLVKYTPRDLQIYIITECRHLKKHINTDMSIRSVKSTC